MTLLSIPLLTLPSYSPPHRPRNFIADVRVCSNEPPSPDNDFRQLLPPNALRRKNDPSWRGGFSLAVDLGASRTGLALGKGFVSRPLTVLDLRGQKLELRLLDIADRQEVDEFIIGLPRSRDGKETPQSNKVRSIAGRLAVQAAERGWRVYLQDEHGTSIEALDYMIDLGLKRSARQGRIDAYAAIMVLERYFSTLGHGTELVLPKQSALREKLISASLQDFDFVPEEDIET
ncbi:hypothetical protein QJS04_geneDACA012437 [Acorus gramineus]|uniref:YqgF/RNase H-like domain-containing protein n=1 Tax=Acorus gramineus TaxID=55184 RepID=A0AAV9BBJ3_ACOGR|nr:hypothetical protein QJS04_geneDACA012437 [Acorus gramineus]